MSYVDQSRRNSPVSIAAVIGVHLAIGYALLSGLAYQVFRTKPVPTIVTQVPMDPPPPPAHEVHAPRNRLPSSNIPTQPQPPKDQPKADDTLVFVPPLLGPSGGLGSSGGVDLTPLPPPKPSPARAATRPARGP